MKWVLEFQCKNWRKRGNRWCSLICGTSSEDRRNEVGKVRLEIPWLIQFTSDSKKDKYLKLPEGCKKLRNEILCSIRARLERSEVVGVEVVDGSIRRVRGRWDLVIVKGFVWCDKVGRYGNMDKWDGVQKKSYFLSFIKKKIENRCKKETISIHILQNM